jgi:2-methylisocitrate lyase-like PEP mutase family enzyme
MDDLSRRAFGKTVAGGVVGGMALGSVPQLASQTASSPVKRMSTVFREMMKAPGIIDSPGVYDVTSARVAEMVGFLAIGLSGNATGVSLCIPEPILTLEDVAAVTRRITAAVNIPMTIDAGAGYGEPAHIVHTVQLLEHAGAAGIQIDDQIYPKRFHYHMGVEHTIPHEAMIEKIRYAAKARRDPDFVIIARTDAMRTHSFAEGIRRANLYAEAGADMVQLFPNTVEEAKQTPKEVKAPLNYVNSEGKASNQVRPVFSLQELEAMGGYKKLNHPTGAILVTYKALRDMLMHLKQTGSSGLDPDVYADVRKEIEEKMIGLPAYYKIENETTEKA